MNLLFHAVIFLGSFLLFLIQPMAAKQLLPVYGGSAAVWSSCMLFFQLLLLFGYGYSHAVQKIPLRTLVVLHGLLLFAAIFFFPAASMVSHAPGSYPVLSLLFSLAISIGPAFFILSTTSPLIQSWAVRCSVQNPYQLYTTSNIASLGALLSYPFLIEPHFASSGQFVFWRNGFILFSLLCFGTSLLCLKFQPPPAPAPATMPSSERAEEWRNVLPWILWPTLGSVLLLGFTSHICRDIAVIPFLWVLPLSVYLLSFVFCFARRPLYRRLPFCLLFLLMAVLYSIPWTGGVRAPTLIGITVCSLALFCGVMIAHGELVLKKPDPTRPGQLTRFYFCMAGGGALGGILVTLVAPFLFKSYFELPLAMSVLATISLLWILPALKSRPLPKYACMMAQAVVLSFAIAPVFMGRSTVLYQDRNFYGVIKVSESKEIISLTDGRIEHGNMYRDTSRRYEPLGYYPSYSGIGQAMGSFPEGQGRKIAIIGLGAGAVCAYALPGDEWWLFELNPAVKYVALNYFYFLKNIPGPYHLLTGDGRLQLTASGAGDFDLIMLDAFSSDSVPVHLLTLEAFHLYLSRLKTDGLIVANITNGHIHFEPLMAALAQELQLHVRIIHSEGNGKEIYPASYAIFSKREWSPAPVEKSVSFPATHNPSIKLWTDDYSNLFQLLRRPI